jgi:hypothetical protein
MADEPKALEMRDFAGLITNAGEFGGPSSGAKIQSNVTVVASQELRVRSGWREVTYEN